MKIALDFGVNVAANIAYDIALLALAYSKRHWILRQISKINWNLSGNVWWFACDLHSIKLQADLDRPARVSDAICKALGHATTIGVDNEIVTEIRKLNDIDPRNKTAITNAVDRIIGRVGEIAVKSQPNFSG
jgi:hypothetical protein